MSSGHAATVVGAPVTPASARWFCKRRLTSCSSDAKSGDGVVVAGAATLGRAGGGVTRGAGG